MVNPPSPKTNSIYTIIAAKDHLFLTTQAARELLEQKGRQEPHGATCRPALNCIDTPGRLGNPGLVSPARRWMPDIGRSAYAGRSKSRFAAHGAIGQFRPFCANSHIALTHAISRGEAVTAQQKCPLTQPRRWRRSRVNRRALVTATAASRIGAHRYSGRGR